MNNINLHVNRINPDNGIQTLGSMIVVDNGVSVFDCCTLELPWKDNQQRISCIPLGEYECEKVPATAAIPYEHILIKNVPDRAGVCVHKANYFRQLKGCIAVGDKHVDINGDNEKDVTNSGKTFDKLMSLLPDKFKLIIT